MSPLYLPGSRFWPVQVTFQFIDEESVWPPRLRVGNLILLPNRRSLFRHCTALVIDISLVSP